jgi:hypothetical protein
VLAAIEANRFATADLAIGEVAGKEMGGTLARKLGFEDTLFIVSNNVPRSTNFKFKILSF